MKMSYKAIARAAGYFVYEHSRGYYWKDKHDIDREYPTLYYLTEHSAYEHCCIDNCLLSEEK